MSKTLDGMSDEELMEKYQMGEVAAFDILFYRYSGRVAGFLSKRLHAKKEAYDLLQEVFFKLHRSKHQYNATLPFSAWIFSITRSVFLDYVKKRRLEDPTDERNLDQHVALEVSASDEPVGREVVSEAMESLSPAQKQAISLRIYDERTFEEIASRLSTSPENARQLVSRGIKRLREIIGTKKE